jgi:hypothetical protein
VTYRERQRLAGIQALIDTIRSHLQRGELSDGLVFDAVRIRLPEIGEAVNAASGMTNLPSLAPTTATVAPREALSPSLRPRAGYR